MMDIDLTQYVAGGYFIIKSVLRDADRSPDLLPERLISLSSECICPSVKIYWGWESGKHHPEALEFGILPEKLPELAVWSKENHETEIDHPNVFLNLEAAQSFASHFLPPQSDTVLLGIGLPESLVADFMAENQQFHESQDGTRTPIVNGVQKILSQSSQLPGGGETIGFEVVSYWQMLGHSWLCSGLERDMADHFGIRPNAHGLIATHTEAMRVYAWIAEDEQRGHRAEPEPYYPWLLVEYPLAAAND
jgi:hypothetical protein